MADLSKHESRSIPEQEDAHSSGGVRRRPVTIVRGEGSTLWDDEGGEYLDLSSGHGWAGLGHAHPAVTRAIQEQAAVLVAHTESSYNDQRGAWFSELGAVLNRCIPPSPKGSLSRIQPTSSGTEAVEGAIKLARVLTGRSGFVAMNRGFHGRTLGSLSATGNPKFKSPFEPLVPGFSHVPFNDVAALDKAVDETRLQERVIAGGNDGRVTSTSQRVKPRGNSRQRSTMLDRVVDNQNISRQRGQLLIPAGCDDHRPGDSADYANHPL